MVPKTHQSYLNSWPHPIAGGSDSGLKAQESAFEKSFLVDPHAEEQCIDRHLGTPGLDRRSQRPLLILNSCFPPCGPSSLMTGYRNVKNE